MARRQKIRITVTHEDGEDTKTSFAQSIAYDSSYLKSPSEAIAEFGESVLKGLGEMLDKEGSYGTDGSSEGSDPTPR